MDEAWHAQNAGQIVDARVAAELCGKCELGRLELLQAAARHLPVDVPLAGAGFNDCMRLNTGIEHRLQRRPVEVEEHAPDCSDVALLSTLAVGVVDCPEDASTSGVEPRQSLAAVVNVSVHDLGDRVGLATLVVEGLERHRLALGHVVQELLGDAQVDGDVRLGVVEYCAHAPSFGYFGTWREMLLQV